MYKNVKKAVTCKVEEFEAAKAAAAETAAASFADIDGHDAAQHCIAIEICLTVVTEKSALYSVSYA